MNTKNLLQVEKGWVLGFHVSQSFDWEYAYIPTEDVSHKINNDDIVIEKNGDVFLLAIRVELVSFIGCSKWFYKDFSSSIGACKNLEVKNIRSVALDRCIIGLPIMAIDERQEEWRQEIIARIEQARKNPIKRK